MGHQLIGLQPAQPGQLHPLHPAEPAELGEQRSQRVRAVKLIGPVGDNDQDPVQDLLAADEERHQVACRAVRPMSILDDQDHGPGLRQALKQRQHLLEQPRPGDSRVRLHVCLSELRQQPGELARGIGGQQRRHAFGAQIADKLPEHRGERREQQAVGAQVQAATRQHPRACGARPGRELVHQTGLADPRLPANEHGGRPASAGAVQSGVQGGQMLRATHKDRASPARAHVFQDATCL